MKSLNTLPCLPQILTQAVAIGIAVGIVITPSWAKIVPVTDAPALANAMRNAVAGDTIAVAPGLYVGDLASSGDPGNLPNGTGYFWVGNDGTPTNPIVVVGTNPSQPPQIRGASQTAGYVIHVTGAHVVLKNLDIAIGDKGVIFDNASYGIMEDCRISQAGAELVHVRDGSSNVKLSRNQLFSSGNGGNGSIGEGFYIGTDQARWGSEDFPQSAWGDKAISEGFGGYDWRVDSTIVQCNFVSGGISAECMDIKEGTRFTQVKDNVFVGDSIGKKPGAESYDDSFIDLKGVQATMTGNVFFNGGNTITRYIAEVTRVSYAHIPDSLTTDGHASPWCDTGDTDGNRCLSTENSVVTSLPADPRPSCQQIFAMDYAKLTGTPTSVKNISATKKPQFQSAYDLLGRME